MEHSPSWEANSSSSILCFVDRASLYNLVNKTNLVHNLFLVYLSISTCFGLLCAHHQEKLLYQCDTWNLSLCVDDRLVCRMGLNKFHPILHTRQSSTQSDKYQVLHWYSYFSWWWAHSCPKHVQNRNKHTRKIVHQVGFIYNIEQGCAVNKTKKIYCSSLCWSTLIILHYNIVSPASYMTR